MTASTEAKPEVRYKYRPAGTSDEITDCDLCGKTGLKKTIILEYVDAQGDSDGERYVGSDCAGVLLSYAEVKTEAELKMSRRELKNARATRRALLDAQAADRKRAEAVAFSRQMLEFFDAAGPAMNDKLAAYVTANPARLGHLSLLEQLKATSESIARHTEVIATGGASALT